uniref:SWIM-type domain-containing protein n=1 Tax=Brassica oleracea var. oleracea TaxID=109376 RepID=A0A0D3DDX1_BRAOL
MNTKRVLAKALVDKPFKDGANKCVVRRSVKGYFDSRLNGQTHRVHLEKRTCSCRKFDITGIPCKHAYGVMLKLKVDPSDYVYAPDVHAPPVEDEQGEETEGERGKETGKKKKKLTKADKTRKRGVNESPTKKLPKAKKRTMHCAICGKANHNSRWHTKQGKHDDSVPVSTSQTAGESSQGTLTQASVSQA